VKNITWIIINFMWFFLDFFPHSIRIRGWFSRITARSSFYSPDSFLRGLGSACLGVLIRSRELVGRGRGKKPSALSRLKIRVAEVVRLQKTVRSFGRTPPVHPRTGAAQRAWLPARNVTDSASRAGKKPDRICPMAAIVLRLVQHSVGQREFIWMTTWCPASLGRAFSS
jgi:hypothetical protein